MFFHSNLPSTVLCDNSLAHGADDEISASFVAVSVSRLVKTSAPSFVTFIYQGTRLGVCTALCQGQGAAGTPPTTPVPSLSAERELGVYPTHSGHFVSFRELVVECRSKSQSCPCSGWEDPSS